ncbi:hypothetical protein QO176_33010, partial [Pseudomonas aeruginosa]
MKAATKPDFLFLGLFLFDSFTFNPFYLRLDCNPRKAYMHRIFASFYMEAMVNVHTNRKRSEADDTAIYRSAEERARPEAEKGSD